MPNFSHLFRFIYVYMYVQYTIITHTISPSYFIHHVVSESNALDSEPIEVVPAVQESIGDHELHDDLAISIPQFTPNEGMHMTMHSYICDSKLLMRHCFTKLLYYSNRR